MFPEGGRGNPDGSLGRFKPGAVRMALESGVPILPVTIRGGERVWPNTMRVPRVGEGAMFRTRIARKLRSVSRGLVRVTDRFSVFSAAVLPGKGIGAWTRKTLPLQASLARPPRR